MKELIFTPPAGSKLRKYWPNGVVGEVTYESDISVHLRVKLKGHCEKDPHTAVIAAAWKDVKEVE